MTEHPIYRYTSIGRPLDPALPTNRAMLMLVPVAALAGAAWALAVEGTGVGPAALQAGISALAAFGTWALGRELLPDDHAAAFVCLFLGFCVSLTSPAPGLLTLFTTLGLVRLVNRSTGLKARSTDSLLVSALVVWTVYETASPWFGAIGALAFLFDATLRKPLRRQLPYALVCLGAMVVYIVDYDVRWLDLSVPDRLPEWLGVFALVLFSLNLVLMRKIHSRGDMSDMRLDLERVKGGMAIAVLGALQGITEMPDVALLVSTIGGLCFGIAFRRAFRGSPKGLRAS